MSETVELELTLRGQSPTEIFVFDGDRHAWLPISQIKNWTPRELRDLNIGETILIEISQWLAEKEELV